MQKTDIDRTDKRILGELQQQAKLSMNQLGERVGLSQTPCWRRIKRLEDAGVIRRRVALLDPVQLDLTVNVFVELKVSKPADSRILARAVQTIPEILECYMISGDTDFLLRVIAQDIPTYHRLLDTLLGLLPDTRNVKSTFALREIKYTTELPIS